MKGADVFMTDPKKLDFEKMFENSEHILSSECVYSGSDGTFTINISSPLTILIQTAGKYCEAYASDVLFEIDDIKNFISQPPAVGEEKLFIMGFRKSGVDHENFVRSCNVSGITYRKVLALKVSCAQSDLMTYNKLTVELKDITDECIGITD